MVDWPHDLAETLGRHTYLVHGGHEFDGREISPLDPDELKRVAADLNAKGIKAVAVASVFSPVNSTMEQEAAAMIEAEVPETSRHDLQRDRPDRPAGAGERGDSQRLPAAPGAANGRRVSRAIGELGITAPLYLTQNDGTLMSAEFAEQYPVLTFACGPTNSMRGAAFLSGLKDAMVVDVGGTTSDVGALTNGFPREASVAVDIGGVRTNFRMPDVYSFGLGGGSLVRDDPLRIGPQSVGYRITEEALVFGGSTLTTTDVAVAAGVADIGDAAAGCAHLDRHAGRKRRWTRIQAMTDGAVDRMKTSAEPMPVIVVGGGSILIAKPIAGSSEMVKPHTLRGGQRGRRGDRPDIGRSRPGLLPWRDARATMPWMTPRPRRPARLSRPAPIPPPCRSSTSKTCH